MTAHPPGLGATAVGCSWGSPWDVPIAFGLFIGASLLHELVHVALMYPISEAVSIDATHAHLGDLHVEAEIRDEAWRHQWADVAGIGPLLLGLGVAAVVLSSGGVAIESFRDFGLIFGWVTFTFLGGASDYQRAASRAGEEFTPEAVADGGGSLLPDAMAEAGGHGDLKRLGSLSFIAMCLGTAYALGCSGAWESVGLGLVILAALLFTQLAARIERRGLSGG